MKTIALIEKGKDDTFGIYTPDLQTTIIGGGISVAEAKNDFENSYHEIIGFYLADNEPLPEELQNLEFEYKYDLASVFNYYTFINVSNFGKITGVNPSLMRQYKNGNTYISEKQISKIQVALRKIGSELSSISLF